MKKVNFSCSIKDFAKMLTLFLFPMKMFLRKKCSNAKERVLKYFCYCCPKCTRLTLINMNFEIVYNILF